MTWSDFYLICFLVGFGLSALALLAGSVHLHLPHLHLHHGVHMATRARAHAAARSLPWFNFGTIAAFLAWFGGTGYLLRALLRRLDRVDAGRGHFERHRRRRRSCSGFWQKF